mmetsp:Transcript_54055/g.107597  ORF Transcript_54055/g.107597 Transcript_54055/m.107597 type:complete len:112 (-) Transcript_54055:365-700(-)
MSCPESRRVKVSRVRIDAFTHEIQAIENIVAQLQSDEDFRTDEFNRNQLQTEIRDRENDLSANIGDLKKTIKSLADAIAKIQGDCGHGGAAEEGIQCENEGCLLLIHCGVH